MQKTLQERTLIDDFLFFAMLNDEVIGEEFGRYLLEIFFDRKFGKRGNPSKGLRELLEYMEDTQKENVKNDTLRVIHNMVNVVKQNKKVSVEYMKIFEKEQML